MSLILPSENQLSNIVTFADWEVRLAGTHINPKTRLATDYLNHFNEPIMLLGMVGDIPEVLEDLRGWRFKTYPEHFLTSNLDYGALAAEAFAHVPEPFKSAFDQTVAQLAREISLAIENIAAAAAQNKPDVVKELAAAHLGAITKLADDAAAIIAGQPRRTPQEEIDKLFS